MIRQYRHYQNVKTGFRIRIISCRSGSGPGFEIFVDLDKGHVFFQQYVFLCEKIKKKKNMSPDKNADPDPGTPKMRIRIQGLTAMRI